MCMPRECSNCKISAGTAFSEELALKIRPCRGPLAARSRPLYGSMWLVEMVLSHAILFFTGGVEAVKMANRKSGKNITFCLIALDPQDRLRYPLVDLFFDMCWWLWLARGVWENLFGIEFVCTKVGS